MNPRLQIAKAAGAAASWGLLHVFHRPAANLPGKLGLVADPRLVADLRPRIREGVVVVVGTNGKTTVTNLVADALEACGKQVACNRTGANLDSGVATALLRERQADWGVFESDELWLARIAPGLAPDYVVLLNLFRDQLDRMGEIALIQDSIAAALESSPSTTLIYNADDPLCQAIADRVDNPTLPFGIAEDLKLAQNAVSDSGMCQRCESLLSYEWRQYGQLGNYRCPDCGFARDEPTYTAGDVRTGASGMSFSLRGGAVDQRFDVPFSGAYLVYNVLAAYAVADRCQVPFAAFDRAVRAFDPQNGRLQRYRIGDVDVLLNLAKNPTGMNQNLKVVAAERKPAAVAFFINDKEADGHDVSWLWDVDFQELAWADDLLVYAGGRRRNDLQVRLKHAGLHAELVDGARGFLERALAASPQAACYLIANYTALPSVKSELDLLSEQGGLGPGAPLSRDDAKGSETPAASLVPAPFDTLRIVHLYPDLLNLYGDGGNVAILANRARWRGMAVEVDRVGLGQDVDLSQADIVFMGGGPDREQSRASRELVMRTDKLRAYVEDDGVLLAICGGYQILGETWLSGDEEVPGLGIVNVHTTRAEGNAHNRLVGDVALKSSFATLPVIGYENHAGRTYLGDGCQAFGSIIGGHGHGNNDSDAADGVRYRNVTGTYLHGPLLAKNPEVADHLIQCALDRRAAKLGVPAPILPPLEDAAEQAANAFMCKRLGVK